MSIDFIGGLPEDLTQELLVGKLLVGGLGVPLPTPIPLDASSGYVKTRVCTIMQ